MNLGTIDLVKMGLQTWTEPKSVQVVEKNYLDGSAAAEYRGVGAGKWRFRGNFPPQSRAEAEAMAEWAKIEANIGVEISLIDIEGGELAKGFISGEYLMEIDDTIAGYPYMWTWQLRFTQNGPDVKGTPREVMTNTSPDP